MESKEYSLLASYLFLGSSILKPEIIFGVKYFNSQSVLIFQLMHIFLLSYYPSIKKDLIFVQKLHSFVVYIYLHMDSEIGCDGSQNKDRRSDYHKKLIHIISLYHIHFTIRVNHLSLTSMFLAFDCTFLCFI